FEENRKRVVSVAGVTTVAQSGAPVGGPGAQAQPSLAVTDAARFLAHPELATAAFRPFTRVILADGIAQVVACGPALEGQRTPTLQATEADLAGAGQLLDAAERIAGRVIINGFPTGVEVCHAMNHGGPYPATTDVRFTSVGTAAILRFARPVCYQNFPDDLLPAELKDANPYRILRTVNGELTRDAVRR